MHLCPSILTHPVFQAGSKLPVGTIFPKEAQGIERDCLRPAQGKGE